MRVAVFLTTPEGVYSGGRYCAYMMAEALAHAGHDVHVVTECEPIFLQDFRDFPNHAKVQMHLTPDFESNLPEGDFDIVVLVPATNQPGFYLRVNRFALERGARLVFLNFESPNWFNAVSPEPREAREWAHWRKWSRDAALILSISEEGDRWARAYYGECPGVSFDYAYPAINDRAADAEAKVEREKRILLFARFTRSRHKGSEHVAELMSEAMRGYTLAIVLGKEDVPGDLLRDLVTRAEACGVGLELLPKLSDREKFREYRRARLVLFPSLFEGFGYPPVEAVYCGTPCVAFDLPVLRETCGDRLHYARHNDWDDFRATIDSALAAESKDLGPTIEQPGITLEAVGQRLSTLFTSLDARGSASASRRAWLRFLDALRLNDFEYRYQRIRTRLRDAVLGVSRRCSRNLRSALGMRGRVLYHPPFDSQEALLNHHHRASWYLPAMDAACRVVRIPHPFSNAVPGERPEHMAASPEAETPIRLERRSRNSVWNLLFSDLVIYWRSEPSRLSRALLERACGVETAYVATDDVAAVEYGTYAGLTWDALTEEAEKERVIAENRERFEAVAKDIAAQSYQAACVFGTGPSLNSAFDFDFADTLCIVCNSIVQNDALLDHIRPRFVCAGDVVSHFGVSTYAAQFRADLTRALLERDLYLVTTARFGALLLHHQPELREKVFLVEQGSDDPVFDLRATYTTPRLDSTLNIHMLPLAATFAKKIWMLGCDGKAPTGANEDFWAHAPDAQYAELVDSGHLCHPTFDVRRRLGTYGRYLRSVARTIEQGERAGIRYGSLHASNVPVINAGAVDLSGMSPGVTIRVADLASPPRA